MATVQPTIDYPAGDRSIVRVTWAALANGDTGQAVAYTAWADRSVQVLGTFGSGGNAAIKGSNDGTTFATLNDPSGSALNVGSASIKVCSEVSLQIRPEITAGDGTTALTVVLVMRTPTAITTRS